MPFPRATTPRSSHSGRRSTSSLAELWDEYRAERARVRFGERELIIARARHEERLERAAA